jgi:glutamine amidotransferase
MRVTVVDYGIGNLYSVCRALEHCGANVELASDAAAIVGADRLVLPGVGAFADGMQGLQDRGLVDAILEHTRTQRPLLGICLGMQMLALESEEFGMHRGIGLIPGHVQAIPRRTEGGQPQKVPHVGWSDLHNTGDADWSASPLRLIPPGSAIYLVHSFHFVPDNPGHLLATCNYGGRHLAAAVCRDNILGFQFHPEKSGPVGLRILQSFLHTT